MEKQRRWEYSTVQKKHMHYSGNAEASIQMVKHHGPLI